VDVAITSTAIVSNKYQFTFPRPGALTPPLADGEPVRADLWFQQSAFWFTSNIIELALDPKGGISTPALAIHIVGPYWPPGVQGFNAATNYPWLCQQTVVRDNHIRKIGGMIDTQGIQNSSALEINSSRQLIVEGNIINQMNVNLPPQILRYSDVLRPKSFNNQLPNGTLIQLFNDPHWKNNIDGLLEEIKTLTSNILIGL
jgi:hypothetical protein